MLALLKEFFNSKDNQLIFESELGVSKMKKIDLTIWAHDRNICSINDVDSDEQVNLIQINCNSTKQAPVLIKWQDVLDMAYQSSRILILSKSGIIKISF